MYIITPDETLKFQYNAAFANWWESADKTKRPKGFYIPW